jgi:hypothetical protein
MFAKNGTSLRSAIEFLIDNEIHLQIMGAIAGNILAFKGTGLVAFLDILGFGQEILKNWNSEKDNPLQKLLELKDRLPFPEKYQTLLDQTQSPGKAYPCRVQTVSDSVIVSFGFDEPMQYGDLILGMISFFDMIAVIWRNALEDGFTIRGAIDFGDIFWNRTEIIGPAFIKAYKLEQENAKTSRVILSAGFNQHLKKIMALNKQTLWDGVIFELIRKDIDGYLIVNPHNLYSHYQNEAKDKQHLIKIIKGISLKADGLNREKYAPLLAALHARKFNLKISDLGKY